jgi:hypothetical protein
VEGLINNNNNEHGHLAMISVNKVAEYLGFKRTATDNWINDNDIETHRIGGRNMVFQIEVDVAIDKIYVKTLIKKYPNSWEEKYHDVAKDRIVCQQVIELLKGESWRPPTTKVIAVSESDNKILKRLSA